MKTTINLESREFNGSTIHYIYKSELVYKDGRRTTSVHVTKEGAMADLEILTRGLEINRQTIIDDGDAYALMGHIRNSNEFNYYYIQKCVLFR